MLHGIYFTLLAIVSAHFTVTAITVVMSGGEGYSTFKLMAYVAVIGILIGADYIHTSRDEVV